MTFWQQLNQLLSEAPGNVVYHLVTLFAIQAVLAIALSQWRRERRDPQAASASELPRRLTLAALGLFLSRFILLIVSLVVAAADNPTLAVRILPPLEQAVNTVTVTLLVWALVPYFRRWPRMTDVAAVLLILLSGVMYTFFAQDWAAMVEPGATYNASQQSTIWGGFQLLMLGSGIVALLVRRFPGGGLRFFTLFTLFAAHLIQFWNFPEAVPTPTEIPVWIRLGHLVSFPLLAVVAYRHSLDRLLASQLRNRPAPEQMAQSLRWASRVIAAPSTQQTLREATEMISEFSSARFVGIATLVPDNPEQFDLTSTREEADEPQVWALKLRDWPALRLAMEQGETVELLADGLGARQLHDFYQEIGMPVAGALLVAPLQVEGHKIGALMLGGPPEQDQWSAAITSIVPSLTTYVARAIEQARRYDEAMRRQETAPAATAVTEPDVVSGRVIALEEERDRALEEIETLSARLQRSEAQRQKAQRQARDLAATVDGLEQMRRGDERVQALESEVAALRESLIEAEEAMAMAAAAEGELSTEWVTTTISRYSGELEEAQIRIEELEAELALRESDEANEIVTSLAQELRTPLTSIAGYTDLMLGETMGILGTRQRDFLQRVRANVERMGMLLDQIVQFAATPVEVPVVSDAERVDVNDVVETAVSTVITQLRKKELRLNLEIAEGLPPLTANRDALCQVLIHLLSNASQASSAHGELALSAHTDTMQEVGSNGAVSEERFMHLAVKDSGGGIRPEDRSHVFDPQYRAENPLIAGLGDTGAALSVAQTLVTAHGGRIWVDSEMGVGSTFSVLLPLANNGQNKGHEDLG